MTSAAIQVVPDDSFDDWIVRGDTGQEFGHYPTREEAEQAGEAIARRRTDEFVIHLPDGRTIPRRTNDPQESCKGMARPTARAMRGKP